MKSCHKGGGTHNEKDSCIRWLYCVLFFLFILIAALISALALLVSDPWKAIEGGRARYVRKPSALMSDDNRNKRMSVVL